MSKRHALVTNARQFAGPPAVEALLAAEFGVVVHDRSFTEPAARAAFVAAHPGCVALEAQEPEAVVAAARQVCGGIDVIVSNDAFAAVHAPVEAARLADLRATLEALVVFPFALAQSAIPHLRERPGARLVMITSNRTRLPQRGGAIPDAARAAQNALVRSLSIELAPHGVSVNAIAPNFLYSESYYPRARFIDDPAGRAFVAQAVPAGRLGRPEEIGELIRFLATTEGSFMTGAIIDFAGGWPASPERPS